MSVRRYLLFDHDSGGSLWKMENTQIQILLTPCKRRSIKTRHTMIAIALFPPNIWTFRLPWDQTSSGEQKKHDVWLLISIFLQRKNIYKTLGILTLAQMEWTSCFSSLGDCPCSCVKLLSMLLVEKSNSLGGSQFQGVSKLNLIILEVFAQCVFQPSFNSNNEAKQWIGIAYYKQLTQKFTTNFFPMLMHQKINITPVGM